MSLQPDRPWEAKKAAEREAKDASERGEHKSFNFKVGGAVIAIIVVIAIWSAFSSNEASTSEDSYGSAANARHQCEQRVEAVLKSPSTADFSDTQAEWTGGNVWDVSGNVDSQNSFGGTVRNSFICTAEATGPESWLTSNIKIG